MTLPAIMGRTPAGGTLYAAIAAALAVPGSPPQRGVVAHSRAVAALAPFVDREAAEDAILSLGIDKSAISER